MPLSAVDAVLRCGGNARTAEVVALASRRRLRTALATGDVVRTARGWISTPVRQEAERAAAAYGGVASHLSAAMLHGWKVAWTPDRPHVTIGGDSRLDEGPDARLFVRRLPSRARHGRITSPLQTVLDCARSLTFSEALAVADSALRSGAVTRDDLLAAARDAASWPEDPVIEVCRHADGRAANPFESVLRAICIEEGVAMVPQWEIRTQGLTLHPDLANPLLRLALEADSWEHHGKHRGDFVRDVVRLNALVLAGWRVLRFTWEQVMTNPDYVRRTLRAAVQEAA